MGYIGNGPYQGVLTGGNIQDGTVETTDLADGAVTTVKINDGAVTAAKLAAGAIPDATSLEDSGGTTRVQATTSGVDVTGTVTADGSITVSDGTAAQLVLDDTGQTNDWAIKAQSNYVGHFYGSKLYQEFTNNGDVIFYDDTTTTPKFFWDASAESLGIGTAAPSHPLEVYKQGAAAYGSWQQLIKLNSPFAGYDENITKVTLDAGVPDLSGNSTLNTTHGWFGVSTNGTDGLQRRLIVDAKGRVTNPYQPSFKVRSSGFTKTSSWQDISPSITTVDRNLGNHWSSSTGRFTAPVAGTYLFFFGGWSNANNDGARYATCFQVNGGNETYIAGSNYCAVDSPLNGHSEIIYLNANDYVVLKAFSAISCTWGGGHSVFWGGQLLG